ncbi:MAG TPA: polysaccharide deacetylase family protein, partial [Candidatus Eisenbacteria bacterium]|nr:polysaccharide deacetylase family protein [Candidatus Eisenbacteria bacterium]
MISLPSVLVYHKVTRFEFGGTWVPPARFASHLDHLLASGCAFIGEERFLETLAGARRAGDREVLLTFDDGYRELLESAVPALESRKIPAHIFILSSYIGRDNDWELPLPGRRRRHLSRDEIRDLSGRGFSFGSHTRTHRDLTRLGPGEVRDELVRSKKELEEILGLPVRTLSYPFGRFDERAAREASRAGYEAAFSMYPPRSRKSSDPFALRREGVYIIDTLGSLRRKVERGPLFWLEDMKGRAINRVAVLTPILKGSQLRS